MFIFFIDNLIYIEQWPRVKFVLFTIKSFVSIHLKISDVINTIDYTFLHKFWSIREKFKSSKIF